MAEELSPESKLYVKEEIEKMRKEFKEDLKEVQSKATKTFSTVAMIVGLLTCVGVYGIAARAIQKGLDETTIKELEGEAKKLVADANNSYKSIVEWEDKSKKLVEAMDGNRIITLESKLEKLEGHRHEITYSGKEYGTGYIKTILQGGGKDRVNIPDGHIIVGAYADGGGTIFYYKKLQIEASK